MYFGERPDPARVEAWNRSYLDHARNPDDPTRCAIPDCLGRFPCAFRVEAAELLVVAGIGLPDPPRAHDVRVLADGSELSVGHAGGEAVDAVEQRCLGTLRLVRQR